MKKKIWIISISLLIIDQITKFVAAKYLQIQGNNNVQIIKEKLMLTYVENKGAAWGKFSDMFLILILLSIVFLIFLIKYMDSFKENIRNTISFSFLFAGVCGNLIDRSFWGFVRDFINLNIFGYNFPVFNIADCLIVIGTCLLIISILKGDDKK